jgi:hypothetical protein
LVGALYNSPFVSFAIFNGGLWTSLLFVEGRFGLFSSSGSTSGESDSLPGLDSSSSTLDSDPPSPLLSYKANKKHLKV